MMPTEINTATTMTERRRPSRVVITLSNEHQVHQHHLEQYRPKSCFPLGRVVVVLIPFHQLMHLYHSLAISTKPPINMMRSRTEGSKCTMARSRGCGSSTHQPTNGEQEDHPHGHRGDQPLTAGGSTRASGKRSQRTEMKTTLSIPNTVSMAVRVNKARRPLWSTVRQNCDSLTIWAP